MYYTHLSYPEGELAYPYTDCKGPQVVFGAPNCLLWSGERGGRCQGAGCPVLGALHAGAAGF